MKHQEVKSSNIRSIGYDENSKFLEVVYKKTGARYRYENVPDNVYKALIGADSIGKFMKTISAVYKYKVVNE